MNETGNTSKFRALEERTTAFAKRVIHLCQSLPENRVNNPLVSQVVRSSGSIGANYREANEALGKKDFLYRLRLARKEGKETQHWFELIAEANPNVAARMTALFQEVHELRNILSAIIEKAK